MYRSIALYLHVCVSASNTLTLTCNIVYSPVCTICIDRQITLAFCFLFTSAWGRWRSLSPSANFISAESGMSARFYVQAQIYERVWLHAEGQRGGWAKGRRGGPDSAKHWQRGAFAHVDWQKVACYLERVHRINVTVLPVPIARRFAATVRPIVRLIESDELRLRTGRPRDTARRTIEAAQPPTE